MNIGLDVGTVLSRLRLGTARCLIIDGFIVWKLERSCCRIHPIKLGALVFLNLKREPLV